MNFKNTEPLFTISIASDLTNSHPRTLMLYEKKGLLTPHRTKTNRRLYSPKDIAKINFIQFLTQKKGINLNGAKFIIKILRMGKDQKVDLSKELFTDYHEPLPL